MSLSTWNNLLRYLQLSGYCLLVSSLPLSNFFMSVSMFWLAGVWLLEIITEYKTGKQIQYRFKRYISNKNALLLTALFALPLIGLLWTEDYKHAFWDIRMKLPLLILPFVLTTLNPITRHEYRIITGFFILSLSFAVLWCLLIYWGVNSRPFDDVREISVFISHVRFSLLLILGLAVVYYESWHLQMGKVLCVLLSVLYIYFLNIIGSVTGFMVLLALLTWVSIRLFIRLKDNRVRIGITLTVLLLLVTCSMFVMTHARQYLQAPALDWTKLEQTTVRGERYEHNPQFRMIENGRYVMTHIAWGEMYSAWQERSTIHPDSLDAKGQTIKGTLIRYLASKGLNKDYDGVMSLTVEDVFAIENGVTGFDASTKSGLNKRLDNILFEYSNYQAGGSSGGHSVFQRFEFWKAASAIIREQPLIGVGTGDVKTAFATVYESTNSTLEKNYRLRAHNQYLTIWLTYGIGGLILFLFVIITPLYQAKTEILFRIFMLIAAMSFLTEDTLESQAGVMFFTFFYVFYSFKKQESLSALRPVKSRATDPKKDAPSQ